MIRSIERIGTHAANSLACGECHPSTIGEASGFFMIELRRCGDDFAKRKVFMTFRSEANRNRISERFAVFNATAGNLERCVYVRAATTSQ
ncbi:MULTISPECIES: hypothetical protein [Variovorax]|uniref:hypothetical protein n=1 Tax=Variovorax TaxID=34072 RepID=UPI00119DAEEC|nr:MULTISPECIES: hypothetical protein [Variovorax]MDR6455972.1 hypothetical protein [Variovorax paradoxus]